MLLAFFMFKIDCYISRCITSSPPRVTPMTHWFNFGAINSGEMKIDKLVAKGI